MEEAVIGRSVKVRFCSKESPRVPAKVDTGARMSVVDASDIVLLKNGDLKYTLFHPGSKYYTGERLVAKKGEYTATVVSNSFGQKQIRYKVKISVGFAGRRRVVYFTLANRENNSYKVLIGVNILRRGFIVDVRHNKEVYYNYLRKFYNLKPDKERGLKKELKDHIVNNPKRFLKYYNNQEKI